MKTINCIAIDDEPHALLILEEYISKLSNLNLIGSFQSPLEALSFFENNLVDLIFLDIQMPELSGLQFLNILKNTPAVILTTAYAEYALDSYEYEVTDYLLKPYSFERFLKATQKIKTTPSPSPMIAATEEKKTPTTSSIFIKGDAKNKFHQVEINHILYIEGLRNYVAIHLKEGKRIITLQNMKSLEDELASLDFLRIHKSYIVNMTAVKTIEGNSLKIKETQLPIGGSYRKAFFKWVGDRNF